MCTRVHTSSDAKMVKRIHHSKYHKHSEKEKVFRGKKIPTTKRKIAHDIHKHTLFQAQKTQKNCDEQDD